MPQLTKHDRAAGAWVSPDARLPVRHYAAGDLDTRCDVCGDPIPRQLVRAGVFEHPSCGAVE